MSRRKVSRISRIIPGPPDEDEYRTGLGFECVVFFSDAVFAIAITLLVLEIRLPEIDIPEGATAEARRLAINAAAEKLPEHIANLSTYFLSYVISFLVLGIYWMNHHRTFGTIKKIDNRLLWLNLLFLMVIAFLPFPTSVLQQYGDTAFAVVFYACTVIAAALMSWAIWLYATRNHGLVDPDLSPDYIRQFSFRSVLTALVFLVSIPIAIAVNPYLAMFFWLTLTLGRPLARIFLR